LQAKNLESLAVIRLNCPQLSLSRPMKDKDLQRGDLEVGGSCNSLWIE
jgi:hypothetical protein